MNRIIKARETMTSRQRVKNTFAYEKTDRVPIGYEYNEGINSRLKNYLGAADQEELRRILGVDYRVIDPPYIGEQLFKVPEGRIVNQLEGSVSRWIENKSGGYWDFCDFPLKDAEDSEFATFPVPDPDDFDYEEAAEKAKAYNGEYALYIGGAGIPDIINSNGRIMGMEDILCHLITENESVLAFVRKRASFQLKMLERLFDKCKGEIDFLWLGEDLGTQIGPMISMDLYKKIFEPIHASFASLAEAYGVPSLMHTCGSSGWAYEEFIKIGIKGVDTLQPEAANMSPEYLAGHFGGRLNFRGCISTAGKLAYGTAEETEKVCRETLEIMMKCRGYHFAPTHQIQDNTPVENVVAMYNAAHKYGVY